MKPARKKREPLTEEQKAVVAENRGLIGVAIKKVKAKIRSVPKNDQDQVGALALMEAAQGFDESRGVQFSTYAVKSICNRLVGHAMTNGPLIRVPDYLYEKSKASSRFQKYAAAARSTRSIDAALDDGFHPVARDEAKPDEDVANAVRRAVEKLPPIERDVVQSVVFRDESMASVGKRHGFATRKVCEIKLRAFAKLRVRLHEHV
jgi:RNA polymerase sigma factor (sigma-70 family)